MDKSVRIYVAENRQVAPEPWLGQQGRIYRDIDPRDDDGGPRETNAASAELTIDIQVSRDDLLRFLKLDHNSTPWRLRNSLTSSE